MLHYRTVHGLQQEKQRRFSKEAESHTRAQSQTSPTAKGLLIRVGRRPIKKLATLLKPLAGAMTAVAAYRREV